MCVCVCDGTAAAFSTRSPERLRVSTGRSGGSVSEVLLSSLLGVHGVQDGLPLGGVALPELLDLPLHHGVQGTQAHLQLLKVQVLQLLDETQKKRQT